MPRSRKITLRDAVASGADEILVYCEAAGCDHVAGIPLDRAIIMWGMNRKLDDLDLACITCGSRLIETRFAWPV